MITPEIDERIKKEFHHLGSTYFNTAYFGPSPYSAKQFVSRAMQKELDPSFFNYNVWMGIPDRIRRKIAELLGCHSDNITHQNSSSDIINIVAEGFPFQKGDVVSAINYDYPSNVLPWMLAHKQGRVTFNLMELNGESYPTPEWLAKNLPKETRIFNISHVTFDTGKKMDLVGIGKILKERDIFFIVDVTQSLGGLPITQEELSYIDVLTCSAYKWMLGPYGYAFGYFNDRAIDLITHHRANWILSPNSKEVYSLLDYTVETLPGARKYDRGQASNMLAMSCLEAGLEFLSDVGLENIAEYNQEIRDYLLDKFPKDKYELITPKEAMGNIIALKSLKSDSISLERELKHRNIDVSVRQGNVRLSFHIFNTKAQIDLLIEALESA